MRNKLNRIIFILFLTLSCVQLNYGQNRSLKTNVIIDSLKIVETQKMTYVEFQLKPLKYEANKQDSIKLIELETLLTDREIRRRIIQGFNDIFTDNEINDIYSFINTTAFYKLLNSSIINKNISAQFKDIKTELDKIAETIKGETDEKQTVKFEPIPIEKEDGFYSIVDYSQDSSNKEIILQKKPSITKEDILDVRKANKNSESSYISITLNKKGARSFYLLTKANVGKPIAIVINKHIISLPIVNNGISGGKASISGDFTNEEIDKMIERLRNKK